MHKLRFCKTVAHFMIAFFLFLNSPGFSDIILLNGPPGSGKGTQAKIISESMNYSLLSLGTLVRSGTTEISASDSLYLPQKDQISRNKQKQKIAQKFLSNLDENHPGLVSDGWPRRKKAIDSFLTWIKTTGHRVLVIRLVVSNDQILLNRALTRKVCPDPLCAASWGSLIHPPNPDICSCGRILKSRFFDSNNKFNKRIQKYRSLNKEDPFKAFYSESWFTLKELSGDQTPDKVSKEISKILREWKTFDQTPSLNL